MQFRAKNWKLARPFYGPYRILSLTPTNAEIRLVDKPNDPAIFVSLNRIRPCYSELGDKSWSGKATRRRKRRSASSKVKTNANSTSETPSIDHAVVPTVNRRITRSMTRKK